MWRKIKNKKKVSPNKAAPASRKKNNLFDENGNEIRLEVFNDDDDYKPTNAVNGRRNSSTVNANLLNTVNDDDDVKARSLIP